MIDGNLTYDVLSAYKDYQKFKSVYIDWVLIIDEKDAVKKEQLALEMAQLSSAIVDRCKHFKFPELYEQSKALKKEWRELETIVKALHEFYKQMTAQ